MSSLVAMRGPWWAELMTTMPPIELPAQKSPWFVYPCEQEQPCCELHGYLPAPPAPLPHRLIQQLRGVQPANGATASLRLQMWRTFGRLIACDALMRMSPQSPTQPMTGCHSHRRCDLRHPRLPACQQSASSPWIAAVQICRNDRTITEEIKTKMPTKHGPFHELLFQICIWTGCQIISARANPD